MKLSKYFNSILFSSSLLLSSGLYANDCPDGTNKLVNGSFEESRSSVVTGWTVTSSNNRATFARSQGYQRCGDYYGLLTQQNGTTAKVYQDVELDSKAISVNLTIWGGIHDRCNAKFRLVFLNASGSEITSARKSVDVTKRVPGLQKYSLNGSVPQSARKVRVEAIMERTQNQPGIYIKMEGAMLSFEYDDTSLPVTLANFSAKSDEGKVSVNWKTTSEVNAKEFEIQHSTNAISWSPIGVVESQGGEERESSYQFAHAEPATGNNYYRLKMIDRDGTFEFSNIDRVQHISRSGALVASYLYPNPSRGRITFDRKPTEVKIFDATGRPVIESKSTSAENELDLQNLIDGVYLVKWSDASGVNNTQRLIISR